MEKRNFLVGILFLFLLSFCTNAQNDYLNSQVKEIVQKVSPPRVAHWENFNADPFDRRDYVRGCRNAGVEEEVIQKLKYLVDNNIYQSGYLKKGDTLLWMLSGNYKVFNKKGSIVICDWKNVPKGFILPCQIYTVDQRIFVRPDKCFNWGEKPSVELPPPIFDSIPVVDSTPVVDIPEDTTPDNETWFDPPQDTVPKIPQDSIPIIEAPSAPSSVGNGFFDRFNLWCLRDFPFWGPGRHGANAYGLKGDLLWQLCPEFAIGLTGMGDGWDGETRTDFFYHGCEAAAGPIVVISFPGYKVHLGLEVIAGSEWNWGKNNWTKYFQTNGIIRPGITLDAIGDFFHYSMWWSYKFSFLEKKDSFLEGVQCSLEDDPAQTRVGTDGGMRFYFGESWKVTPLLVYRGSYAKEDKAISTAIGCGARFGRWLIIETSFKNRSNSEHEDSNGNSFELLVNLKFGKKNW